MNAYQDEELKYGKTITEFGRELNLPKIMIPDYAVETFCGVKAIKLTIIDKPSKLNK